ncbi:hypothetical protein J2Z62_000783 [Mycoplasmoides fastidiosum]|uniref:Uncharacterized protein n=1 Tax=Mycoplasmoides fastidiosum TaxID=92758 RepID=A0ABU0M067_9BACT|nr:hypothetical protein [Mycoplasmoides fastidiosum]MDQ0514345.1 hypothetical protein [Mycoplasmoides fastidiosum]UUD38053.1 hypothetical protein NPA10_01510 [Mycoplasmoides fastidiosum]
MKKNKAKIFTGLAGINYCFFLLTLSFPIYLLIFFQAFFGAQKIASQPKPDSAPTITFDWKIRCKIWWSEHKQTIMNYQLLSTAMVGSFIISLVLILLDWDGFLVLCNLLIATWLVSYFGWQFYQTKKNQPAPPKIVLGGADQYKQKVLGLIYLLATFIISGICLILFFVLNQNKISTIDGISFYHNTSQLSFVHTAPVPEINDFNVFFQDLNLAYGAVGFNTTLFLVGILTAGLSWWIGISGLVWLFITQTYQPVIFLITYHLNNAWTWGALFAFFVGFGIATVLKWWLKNHINFFKNFQNNYRWITGLSSLIFNWILFGSTYFHHYAWTVAPLVLALICWVVFIVINSSVYYYRQQLKPIYSHWFFYE